MKKIVAKVGTYEKNGETKNRYVNLGVIRENQNGEYVLLDSGVNLAGILIKQLQMAPEKTGGSVMCSVFSDDFNDKPKPKPQADDGFDSDIPF